MIRLTKTIGGAKQMWGTGQSKSGIEIKDSGGGNERDVVCIATTDAVDLDREVVIATGADLAYFEKNKSIFMDHAYGTESFVGVMRSVTPWPSPKSQRGWEVRFRVNKGEAGDRILEMFRDGDMGVSIGFEPVDYGPPTKAEAEKYPGALTIVRTWKWIELSATALPCNVEARGRAVGSIKHGTASGRKMLVVDGVVVVV